jgi:dynein heavy chain 1
MDAVDEWVDKKAMGKANLSPGAIPWDALQALLEQIIYGGRIDNEFDQARLHAFVTSLFTSKAYDGNFAMCSTWDADTGAYKPLMTMPDGKDFAAFKTWVDALPDVSSPELLGLPSNAESMLLSVAGEHMAVGVLKLQDTSGGEEDGGDKTKAIVASSVSPSKRLSFNTNAATTDRPIWMVSMEHSTTRWLAQLPPSSSLPPLPEGKAAETLVLHPLYRCMQREYNIFRGILLAVHEDLTLVKAVLSGKEPANNKVRALFIALKKDALPVDWGKPENALSQLPTTLWMTDFVKRCEQMAKISKTAAEQFCGVDIWLGGLQSPEAFVAATRQAVAQAHSWSLEDVELRITVGDTSSNRADSYTFLNLDLQGAVWEGSSLSISNTALTFKMPPVRFTWVKNDAAKAETSVIRTPFYLDQTRSKYLFAGNLSRPTAIPENVWSQRGLAVTCWSS